MSPKWPHIRGRHSGLVPQRDRGGSQPVLIILLHEVLGVCLNKYREIKRLSKHRIRCACSICEIQQTKVEVSPGTTSKRGTPPAALTLGANFRSLDISTIITSSFFPKEGRVCARLKRPFWLGAGTSSNSMGHQEQPPCQGFLQHVAMTQSQKS